MIRLNNLSFPAGAKKKSKRRGRGTASGIGGTSGKGHKGQSCRSGAAIPDWFEGGQMPLQRRIRKYGFKNRYRKEFNILDVSVLNNFPEGTRIDPSLLKEKNLINKKLPVKLLGKSPVNGEYTVEIDAITQGARESIEKKGGKVIILSLKGKEVEPEGNDNPKED
jgi:large subunit ribosomal protein L15